VLLTFVVTILLGLLPVTKTCEVCMVAVNNFDTFIALFYLFFSIYLMSHYFVAEKNMAVISPSMFIGFVVYVMSVVIGFNLSVDFSVISIYSLCISLMITFIIRYVWLLNQNKSKDKKITC
jgi:heme A synthase